MVLFTFVRAGKVNFITAREGVNSTTPKIEYSGFKAEFAFNTTGYCIDVSIEGSLEKEEAEFEWKPEVVWAISEKGCMFTTPSEIYKIKEQEKI